MTTRRNPCGCRTCSPPVSVRPTVALRFWVWRFRSAADVKAERWYKRGALVRETIDKARARRRTIAQHRRRPVTED